MNARYYVPNTNRMVSPDTIVPDPANPQSFNRYSYVENNPINFSDPTGHCKNGRGTGPGTCQVVGGGSLADGSLIPTGDAVHQVVDIDIRMPVRNPTIGVGCIEDLTTCFEMGLLKDFEEGEQIGLLEFNELLATVADELHDGWVPGSLKDLDPEDRLYLLMYSPDFVAGRGRYDTPFYNGDGKALGNEVCIASYGCYTRDEVNYFAQGMWSAAGGDTLDEALELTEYWNQSQYSHPPSEGELFWTEFGYNWYKERYSDED